jgi:hypothetical protein
MYKNLKLVFSVGSVAVICISIIMILGLIHPLLGVFSALITMGIALAAAMTLDDRARGDRY